MRRMLLLICVLFSALPILSCVRDAAITDMLVTHNRENVVLYAKLVNCFTKDMDAAILAGVPTTFTLIIDLYRERSHWFDEKVSRKVVKQTVQYDSVKKIFSVSSTEGTKATFQDFDGAKRAMAELSGIIVAPLKSMDKAETFYVMAKAKLDTVRLPLHMENVFSLWDFETDWHRQRFVY